jgi:hypothetical protein
MLKCEPILHFISFAQAMPYRPHISAKLSEHANFDLKQLWPAQRLHMPLLTGKKTELSMYVFMSSSIGR